MRVCVRWGHAEATAFNLAAQYVPYCDAFPDARSGWLDQIEGAADAPDYCREWVATPPQPREPQDSVANPTGPELMSLRSGEKSGWKAASEREIGCPARGRD